MLVSSAVLALPGSTARAARNFFPRQGSCSAVVFWHLARVCVCVRACTWRLLSLLFSASAGLLLGVDQVLKTKTHHTHDDLQHEAFQCDGRNSFCCVPSPTT